MFEFLRKKKPVVITETQVNARELERRALNADKRKHADRYECASYCAKCRKALVERRVVLSYDICTGKDNDTETTKQCPDYATIKVTRGEGYYPRDMPNGHTKIKKEYDKVHSRFYGYANCSC